MYSFGWIWSLDESTFILYLNWLVFYFKVSIVLDLLSSFQQDIYGYSTEKYLLVSQ